MARFMLAPLMSIDDSSLGRWLSHGVLERSSLLKAFPPPTSIEEPRDTRREGFRILQAF